MVWIKSPQSLIDLFDKSVPSGEGISLRKMFGYPAAFANGKALSAQDRARFTAEFGERTFEPMKGRPMREYVRLPEQLLADARKRAAWIKRSLRYAETVVPKAKSSTRKQSPRSVKGSRT